MAYFTGEVDDETAARLGVVNYVIFLVLLSFLLNFKDLICMD
jgi:hypothetical protein